MMIKDIERHEHAHRYAVGCDELTTTDHGIIYGSIAQAATRYGYIVEQHMPDAAKRGGVFVYIPKKVICDRPVELEYVCRGDCATNTLIVLEEEAQANVLIYVDGRQGGEYTVKGDCLIAVDAGANLSFGELIFADGDIAVELSTDIRMMADSRLNGVTAELGNGRTKLVYHTDLAGRNIECRHSTLFMVADNERTAVDETVNHLIPDCHSDILVKGVASGNAEGYFKGLVFVAQDAQHTQAYQQSRNLLISDKARIETSPQLEIYADDVKCSHGATVGQVNDDSLFYMRQRGLSEAQARKLQLKGFVEDVLTRSADEVWMRNAARLAEKKIEML